MSAITVGQQYQRFYTQFQNSVLNTAGVIDKPSAAESTLVSIS